MFYDDDPEDRRLNREVMPKLAKDLRKMNAARYRLKQKPPISYLTSNTSLSRRNLLIGYNNSERLGNTLVFTGQCLLKDQEDLECPVTIEDAIECERLAEILSKTPTPSVCIYPDSTYVNFIAGWSGESADQRAVETCTKIYMRFRDRILPNVTHIKTSDYEQEIKRILAETGVDIVKLRSEIRRIYGGRIVENGQSHSLQQSVLEYGIKGCLIPKILERTEKTTVTFAEPDEICSVSASQIFAREVGFDTEFSLIGQVPLPPVEYDRQNVRMYSALRAKRIHINETSTARSKFLDNPEFLLLYLYMSPLTTEDQLAYIGKSRDRRIGIDIAMEQIKKFSDSRLSFFINNENTFKNSNNSEEIHKIYI
jgi:hypothetical protein